MIIQKPFAKADPHRESLFVGFLGLLLFTAGLWRQPFVEFETRFALFAQEMWRHGLSVFPTAYGEPYPDYPATSTILIWLFSLPFGAVTKLSAVLPTAISAALTLMITYRLLTRFSRKWALLTIGFEILTVTFLAEARSISLDQMLATITLFSFYLAYTTAQNKQHARLAGLSLLLVFGFLIRGPLGVVIPAAVVCSYYLLSAQWRRLVTFGLSAALILFVCWVGLLALAEHLYSAEFAHDVVHMQVAGRLNEADAPGVLYYFTSSFGNYALAYPIAVLVIISLAISERDQFRKPFGEDSRSLLIFFMGWILIVIAGLSIPHAKKARYLLPIVPAIAALAAYPLITFVDTNRSRALKYLGFALEKILLVLPTLVLIGLWVATRHTPKNSEPLHLPLLFISALLIAYQVTAIVVQWRGKQEYKAFGALLAAVLAVWTVNLLVAEPIALQLHDSHKFVQQVEAMRRENPGEVVFFRVGKDAAAIKYMVNVDYDLKPLFLNEPNELKTLRSTAYLIVEDGELPALESVPQLSNLRPVLHDRFDHHFYSVFRIAGIAVRP